MLLALAIGCVEVASPARAEETFGQAIKRVFNPTPTPTPKKKKVSTTVKKTTSPTPAPSSSPHNTKTSSSKHHRRSHKQAAAEEEETSPTPTVTPEATISPSPSPSASEAPSGKKKKKATPTPTPTETPTPSPTTTASPSPSSRRHKKSSPTPTPEETPKPTPSPNEKKEKPPGVSISPNEISGFENYPGPVKKLVTDALELASRGLSYQYGSADPSTGGLDCSGFVYYLLKQQGLTNVPRDSSELYIWVRKSGKFEVVVSRSDDTFELANLKPGDLMFWTGTYDINRDPPITHAMIYLGREKSTGRRIMVGASDGRTYHDESRYGVSVFDFRVSRPGRAATNGRTPDFVGYGKIPGLGD